MPGLLLEEAEELEDPPPVSPPSLYPLPANGTIFGTPTRSLVGDKGDEILPLAEAAAAAEEEDDDEAPFNVESPFRALFDSRLLPCIEESITSSSSSIDVTSVLADAPGRTYVGST